MSCLTKSVSCRAVPNQVNYRLVPDFNCVVPVPCQANYRAVSVLCPTIFVPRARAYSDCTVPCRQDTLDTSTYWVSFASVLACRQQNDYGNGKEEQNPKGLYGDQIWQNKSSLYFVDKYHHSIVIFKISLTFLIFKIIIKIFF